MFDEVFFINFEFSQLDFSVVFHESNVNKTIINHTTTTTTTTATTTTTTTTTSY